MALKKKNIPWNKGKPFLKLEKHPLWKGDNVGYHALHDWVRKYKNIPDNCEVCGKKSNKLDAANISGLYKRDLNDFKFLCKKCHSRFDYESRPKGEKSNLSKLKEKDIISIFKFREIGMTYTDIGKLYGVTKTAIWRIIKRINWKHIEI